MGHRKKGWDKIYHDHDKTLDKDGEEVFYDDCDACIEKSHDDEFQCCGFKHLDPLYREDEFN